MFAMLKFYKLVLDYQFAFTSEPAFSHNTYFNSNTKFSSFLSIESRLLNIAARINEIHLEVGIQINERGFITFPFNIIPGKLV